MGPSNDIHVSNRVKSPTSPQGGGVSRNNDRRITALSAVYHILYTNINQFEQPVSRRHLICSDIEIHQERCSAKSKSQRSAVVIYGILVRF